MNSIVRPHLWVKGRASRLLADHAQARFGMREDFTLGPCNSIETSLKISQTCWCNAGHHSNVGRSYTGEIPNLAVLPAGSSVRNPLALMTSDEFFSLIDHARKSYDLVFIDSPPLLPVVDTRILRKMSDMLVFVVRADATPRAAVVRSLRDMSDVAGVVFNSVSPGSFRRYYYHDAYSRYAYGNAPTDGEEDSSRG